ncbi:alpha/beta hydrolase [Streptomyces sp. NPDC058646]|uniref:alpha/beta hydrolase n=1 Tax=Streptomyces sp. NPDC058646 TaxID=3346574 RepID=UPI00365D6A02
MNAGSPAARAGGGGALVVRRDPPRPRAAVLFLHGGRADALEAPPALNAPGVRTALFASALIRATRGDRIAVARVRYRHRGWNGTREDPVHDAREALGELVRRMGEVPVVLVGHSMGGRAALRVAGRPQVCGVVALAPWCPPHEPVAQLRERFVAVLHDQGDRVTSAEESWEFLERAAAAGARTLGVRMPAGGHGMLRDARTWHGVATSLALGMLGLAPLPSALTGAAPGPVVLGPAALVRRHAGAPGGRGGDDEGCGGSAAAGRGG